MNLEFDLAPSFFTADVNGFFVTPTPTWGSKQGQNHKVPPGKVRLNP